MRPRHATARTVRPDLNRNTGRVRKYLVRSDLRLEKAVATAGAPIPKWECILLEIQEKKLISISFWGPTRGPQVPIIE